eukprot:TRINITY_DN4274_c0_g1_i2.p1 TRINITY_DN4274_c0_g1~~TRINITY_DN4274_c0_g1_i2.p1  ORF type:complete len:462 (-),score=43.48 TRINITY_DN4274_c0_g1_i2:575-1909(-)
MVWDLVRQLYQRSLGQRSARLFSSAEPALEETVSSIRGTQTVGGMMAYSVDDYIELISKQRQFIDCIPNQQQSIIAEQQQINGDATDQAMSFANEIARIRVVTYNILANKYIGEHVKYCQSALLRWELRKQKIMAEIEAYKSDILFLQEVEQEAFKYDFLKLRELGYTGIIASGEVAPALFYKSKIFKLLDFEINGFQSLLNSPAKLAAVKTAWGVSKEVDQAGRTIMNGGYFFTRLKYTSNGAYSMALLQHIPTNTPVLVVSVHLFWNPAWPDVKVGQAALLCQRMRAFVREAGYNGSDIAKVPCIVGGDFNSLCKKTYTDEYDELPKDQDYLISGVYKLMQNGQLDHGHHDHPLPRRRTEEKLSFNTAGFKFSSIYYQGEGDEPPTTNKTADFGGCLDYVFVSPHWQVKQLLQILPPDCDPYLTLGYPSDHLAVGGTLSLHI